MPRVFIAKVHYRFSKGNLHVPLVSLCDIKLKLSSKELLVTLEEFPFNVICDQVSGTPKVGTTENRGAVPIDVWALAPGPDCLTISGR